MSQFTRVAKKLIKELKTFGIEAYIWHAAKHGSCYIRFEDQRIGSIRLGDHPGRSKLKYKYNLRSDWGPYKKKSPWYKHEGMWRFYLPLNDWKEIIPALRERAETVKTWPVHKYHYYVPHFKEKDERKRLNK